MRTLALAIAAAVCLGTSAADAVCTTGVECIRERYGIDNTVRNNRIIDRTDGLGDRGRPLNPYIAGQNVANQARRAGRFDSTTGGTTADRRAVQPVRPGEIRPDALYTPGTTADPSVGGSLPGERRPETDGSDLTIAPYDPAEPATGQADAAAAARNRGSRTAPARRDQNAPQGAAELRYSGPRSSGAYR